MKRYDFNMYDTHPPEEPNGDWCRYADAASEIERRDDYIRQMVEKAADKSLAGYRELGATCAKLSDQRDGLAGALYDIAYGDHDGGLRSLAIEALAKFDSEMKIGKTI